MTDNEPCDELLRDVADGVGGGVVGLMARRVIRRELRRGRPPRLRALVMRALILVTIAVSGCDPEVLQGIGDVELDAGVDIAGDAGVVFEPDAGFDADAGVIDAGSFQTCPFTDNPDQPWGCEADVDVCDPIDSINDGGSDLLASWSFFEGDEFVVQARLRAPPLRSNDWRFVSLLFADGPVSQSGWFHATGSTDHPFDEETSRLVGAFAIELMRCPVCEYLDQWPPLAGVAPTGFAQNDRAYDRCKLSLGRSLPIVEWRVPAVAVADDSGLVRYSVSAWGSIGAGVGEVRDVLWYQTTPTWQTSLGGHSDDEADLVSLCDLTCPLDEPAENP